MKDKQICANCHFFVGQNIDNSSSWGPPKKLDELEINSDLRKNILEGYAESIDSCLACHFGVWDERIFREKDGRNFVIVNTNRKNFCFFWKYHSGMLVSAAEILQKREADNRDASKDRRYTIIGLWIAGIGLILNAIATFISKN